MGVELKQILPLALLSLLHPASLLQPFARSDVSHSSLFFVQVYPAKIPPLPLIMILLMSSGRLLSSVILSAVLIVLVSVLIVQH